jgi:phosphoserine phosphatase
MEMRLALFLDVDKTLTLDYIQKEYARALGCEADYCAVEAEFQRGSVDSPTFGKKIIELFAREKFTEERASALYEQIRLQDWTPDLLKLLPPADIYLVSSGPSYFIDALAKNHRIPEGNVCRSEYSFNPKTGIIESCRAVDEQDKAFFVQSKRGEYRITIGVGDSPRYDGPFISNCTIQLMTVSTANFIYIPDLKSVMRLIRRLSEVGEDAASIDTSTLTAAELFQLLRRMTVGAWATLLGGFGVVGSVAFWLGGALAGH